MTYATTRHHDARGPKKPILQPIAAARLADDDALGELFARLMRDRFVQVRIELLAGRVDRLESVFGQKIHQLFQDHAHAGKHGRVLAFAPGRFEAELEVIDDGDEPLEERAVGVLDRFLFLARGAFLVILEVGLAAQRQIAKAVEIGLQRFILVLIGRRPGRRKRMDPIPAGRLGDLARACPSPRAIQ